MKPAALVAVLFLVIVALLHLLRLIFQMNLTLGSTEVPMWASLCAVIALSALAVWLWKEQRR